MPHKCTKCGNIFPDAAPEILYGCSVCGAKFFYYIREEWITKDKDIEKVKEKIKDKEIIKEININKEIQEKITEINKGDKIQIEKDIRELTGLDDEPDKPVVLDLESVKVLEPGKFEIDLMNLFSKKRVLIYKLEEGKYIIDLEHSFKIDKKDLDKKIRDPKSIIPEENTKKKSVKQKSESYKEKDSYKESEDDNEVPEKESEEVGMY